MIMRNSTARQKGFLVVMSFLLMFGIMPNASYSYAAATDQPTVINVALYDYVPDPERFQQAVVKNWAEVEPNVRLNFVKWDGYEADPDANVDVFVFDAIFLSHFVDKGYLKAIPQNQIQDRQDIIDFAMEGCTVNGAAYCIPQIVCTNLLFYREDDTALASVRSVPDLYRILGERQSTGVIPDNNEGLLIDMSGGTTKAAMYLDALLDTRQQYTDYTVLPDPNTLNSKAFKSLKQLQKMGGKDQIEYWPDNNDAYIRADWFRSGIGRAFIGYTEAMSSMGDYADDVNFKTISMSSKTDIPVFYGDMVGVNSAITDPAKQDIAIKLANVITASQTMVDAISPNEAKVYPQYLLPARHSVYQKMQQQFPIYSQLIPIATHPDNKIFKMGPDARNWIEQAKVTITDRLATVAVQ